MDWNVILGAVSILQTAALFYVGAKASKIDKLEERLEEAASRRIDERFTTLDERCRQHRGELAQKFADVQTRLSDGDEHFDTVDERNQKIELQVMAKVSELKQWLMETFVSKADLQTFLKAMRNSNQN